MDDKDSTPKEYQKGFNEGYLLAKHTPDLADKLLSASGESIQINALKKGIEEYKLEKTREHNPAWLKKGRLSELKDNSSKDKSKDDLSLEKN